MLLVLSADHVFSTDLRPIIARHVERGAECTIVTAEVGVQEATHNMVAWRIRGPPGSSTVFQDCDDDGETAAGGRMLHLLQLMDVWDVVVVVSRWYGGHKLGPRRFALINSAARDGFVKAGFVFEGDKSGKKKK